MFAGEVLQHFIDKVITPSDHRRGRGIAPTVTPPYQYLIDGLTFPGGSLQGGVGLFFMIEQRPVAVIAVHGDQDAAARVGDAFATRLPTEATKDHRVNGTQASAGQHGHGEFRYHRHVNGDAITRLDAGKVPQQRCHLVHPHIQFVIGDRHVRFVLWLWNVDDGRFVFILR